MGQDVTTLQVAWIGALSALAGAIIGGLIAFLGEYLLRRAERMQLARQLARGLAGEIAALVEIVERRQYVNGLRNAAAKADTNSFSAAVTRNYFKVFDVNANQLGLLPGNLPETVTGFYVRASALAEDFNVISDPTFSQTHDVDERREYYSEMASLLEETTALGKRAVADLRK